MNHLRNNGNFKIASFVRHTDSIYIHMHAQLCLTFCDPVDCSLPGSSVYEIFQAGILE